MGVARGLIGSLSTRIEQIDYLRVGFIDIQARLATLRLAFHPTRGGCRVCWLPMVRVT